MKRVSVVLAIGLVAVAWAATRVYQRFHFPQIRDWKSVRITLERTGCFGTCPSYRLEVHGDGTVRYMGTDFVAITGEHSDRISEVAVRQLVDAFRAVRYFSLNDRYEARMTDNPTYKTSIAFDNVSKSVVDYVGGKVGMPSAVSKLEQTIDRLAGSQKWVSGNAETVPSLAKEGWDFNAADAAHRSMLINIAQYGDAHAVRDLLSAGAPVESYGPALIQAAGRGDGEMVRMLLESGAGAKDRDEKSKALEAASYTGVLGPVRLLLAFGADARYASKDGFTPLMTAARTGVPEVVAELLKHHPNVNARDDEGKTALMYVGTLALPDTPPGQNRGDVVLLLVRAGADVNAADRQGYTALMEACWQVEVSRALIENGAHVNARNRKGWTALVNCNSPEIIRFLLASGADPAVRDERGKTALENAQICDEEEKVALIKAALAGKFEGQHVKQ